MAVEVSGRSRRRGSASMEEPDGSGEAPVSIRGRARGRRNSVPLKVRIELVVVDGADK
jgi:hypothetical protein